MHALILVHEVETITTKPLVVNLAVHIIVMHRRLQLVNRPHNHPNLPFLDCRYATEGA